MAGLHNQSLSYYIEREENLLVLADVVVSAIFLVHPAKSLKAGIRLVLLVKTPCDSFILE